ncbi:hypothetical protein GP486_000155 [Trichoglossum hirsutum]|uniref:VPS9 domain-containing protein n=1 Tax=Trichoglossum hirsutum TaxID=265104 RepID=A0A9P8RTU6_9PEZI|nr:hypothetical protein GP486_000155 [Trichoglossum hirsutum]
MSDHRSPRPLQVSKSFSRFEAPTLDPLAQHRAPTTVESPTPELVESPPDGGGAGNGDLFEQGGSEHGGADGTSSTQANEPAPAELEELPIELVSLVDRFVDSLSAKVHPTPPSMDKLSSLFQDFYVLASSRITTHIDTLSSRQHRRLSPTPTTSSRSPSVTKASGRSGPNGNKDKVVPERSLAEQQMLTASEIESRRKARKQLERMRLALEEAVERRVCEGVYDRIWRHRSTQDEERDEKLRSRTAALSVVGVGLAELGVNLGTPQGSEMDESREEHVREWLSSSRESLMKMNDEKYPLGKLLHLKAAHKSIVDTLSHFHPSSSSADEILPTLIYTLITTPTEGTSVISNLYFIQRFRAASKVDGEAAYCLTNLEAAITFLENVDLAGLKPDELQLPPTPKHERPNPITLGHPPSPGLAAPAMTPARAMSASSSSPEHLKSLPSSTQSLSSTPSTPLHQRRLSHLLQPPTSALGAAGDAVITTADQGLKTIGNTLESSYNFLFGRLKERGVNASGEGGNPGGVVLPKTLDEARRLVGTPPPVETTDDKGLGDGTVSLGSSTQQAQTEGQGTTATIADDKLLGLVGGQKRARDRSVDSGKSGSSGRMAAVDREVAPASSRVPSTPGTASPLGSSSAAVESMRNLGSTLNPLNRLAGMGVMRSFGRSTTNAQAATTKEQGNLEGPKNAMAAELPGVADLTTAFPDLAPALSPKEPPRIAPPVRRFMELENPGDLKISEVLELLRDYRRLANALKDLGAV